MVGKTVEGTELNAKIQFEFDQLKTIDNKIRTAYLIWKEPYMTVGGDTFIHSMLAAAGLERSVRFLFMDCLGFCRVVGGWNYAGRSIPKAESVQV